MDAHILLVEDDLAIAQVVRDTLRRNNYQVTWATTGMEGWEDFQLGNYDLVLVDLMLPEMDGFSLCKNIRRTSDVPMIIISARKDDMDKVEGLETGADDYLEKPFSLVELKARIESHLRRWRRYQGIQEKNKQIIFQHGLVIDLALERVFLEEKEIILTTKEFELLKLLSDNIGKTFSKEELLELIWKSTETEVSHTIPVHIKSLRQKLGDPIKQPLFIQTVWGKGYRFIGETL